jgi:HSP20 family protein
MHWDTLRELLHAQERLDRTAGQPTAWNPAVDLYETNDRYVVVAELPGLTSDDIEITAHDDSLVVRGERRPPAVCPDQFHQVERGHGAFGRRFAFPQSIDATAIGASFANGVLTITVPKAPPRGTRRIEVK